MDRPWVREARCGWLLELSWISDARPTDDELDTMQRICDACPVRIACAQFATTANNGRGVDGGFYAGIWIPWANSTETEATRLVRSRGRRKLRQIASLLPVPPVKPPSKVCLKPPLTRCTR